MIGAHSLIGIGSHIASGTIVEDHVLLAAGARTVPGQRLTAGFWGGDPARKLGELDDAKKRLIEVTVKTYCGYAAELGAGLAPNASATRVYGP